MEEYGKDYQQPSLPKYECLLFDLDDTLYPRSSGLSERPTPNILKYMIERLGIDAEKALDMRRSFCKNYGTTMAGLRAIGYNFDYDEYHSFISEGVPYDTLNPDDHLRTILLSLPVRKVIFSNADKVHVDKVLSRLGLEDCFDEIICFETLNPPSKNGTGNDESHMSGTCFDTNGSAFPPSPILCKPQETAFEVALNKANINPLKTLFFDDNNRNLQAAKRMGLHTVLVGTSVQSDGVDFALESIYNMKEALPGL